MIADASDDTSAAARRDEQAHHARADEIVVQSIMSTADGRSFMWRFLESCHIFESCFVPSAADATAYQLGERNVGLKVLAQIHEAAPEEYLMAMTEAREAAKRAVKTEEARVARDEEERDAAPVQFPEIEPPERMG